MPTNITNPNITDPALANTTVFEPLVIDAPFDSSVDLQKPEPPSAYLTQSPPLAAESSSLITVVIKD